MATVCLRGSQPSWQDGQEHISPPSDLTRCAVQEETGAGCTHGGGWWCMQQVGARQVQDRGGLAGHSEPPVSYQGSQGGRAQTVFWEEQGGRVEAPSLEPGAWSPVRESLGPCPQKEKDVTEGSTVGEDGREGGQLHRPSAVATA